MTKVRWIPDFFRPADAQTLWLEPDSDGRISLRDALPGCAPGTDIEVWRNGAPVDSDDDRVSVHAGPRDEIVVRARPGAPLLIPVIIPLLISAAASFVISMLMRPPKPSEDTGDDGPTYGFGGLRGQRSEGRPIQLIYGLHRTAGTILNEGIENRRTARGPSEYAVQIAFGAGQIRAIGDQDANTGLDAALMTDVPGRVVPSGIYLDGNPIENIPGVVASVRLGMTSQSHAPLHDLVEQSADVDQELTAPEVDTQDPDSAIIVADSTAQSVQDTYWDSYGRAFDLPEEAEFCRVTLSFTRGYFKTSGVVQSERNWVHIVRYIELDGDGRPITTGGNEGDGYVRLFHRHTWFSSDSSFSIDYQFPLFDARVYSASPSGFSLICDGTNGTTGTTTSDCRVVTPNVPWTDGGILIQFSVSAWVNPHGFVSAFSEENVFCVAFQKTGTTSGFAVRFAKKTFTTGPSTSVIGWVPVLEMPGSLLAGGEFFEGHDDLTREPRFIYTTRGGNQPLIAPIREHHIVFTYSDRVGVDTVNDRLRLYVDGVLMYETLGNVLMKGSAATLHMGRDPALTRPMDGQIDELWIVRDELTHEDVKRAYNNGAGIYGTVGTSGGQDEARLRFDFFPANLVFGYHFDENLSDDGTVFSFDTLYTNTATADGHMRVDGIQLVPLYLTTNKLRKARYRIEVARNIPDSTHNESFDDGVLWSRVTWATEQRQQFPGIAVLSLRVAASETVNQTPPEITADVKGRLCLTWTGSDPVNPVFVRTWTRSPAWIATDLLLTTRHGLGDFFAGTDLDVISMQAWADVAAEVVYDLRGNRIFGSLASKATAPRVTRLRYDTDVALEPVFSNRGRIQIFLDGPPPANWTTGRYVAWTGEATVTGFVDHNFATSAAGGYEIHAMTPGGGSSWTVAVFWDRLDEGDPWDTTLIDGNFLDQQIALSTTPYVGRYEGRVVRHTYDAVLDTAREAWDLVQDIASVGRAIAFFDGSKVRVKVNAARQPVGIVSMGSILEDSFEVEYGGPNERPNSYIVEFLDEDNGWERSSGHIEHEDAALATATTIIRQESVFVPGMTRRAAALRHGKFIVNVDQGIRRTGSFRSTIDAVHYEPGDVLVAQHDLLAWGLGGRTFAGATTASEIILDREVIIGAVGTWFVDVSDPVSNGFLTREITTVAGTYPAGTVLTLDTALPFTPTKDLRYVFYEAAERKLIEITALRLAKDLTVDVEWAEYIAAVYNDLPTAEPTAAPPLDTWAQQDGTDTWATQNGVDTWGKQA